MNSPATYEIITDVMQGYFDGLYHADTSRLAEVFHPDAHYVNMVEGDYMNKSLSEYFDMVDQRTPPAEQGTARNDNLLSITLGGDRMAFVWASMTMMGREYLDFLTLVNDEKGWRIMSKIFTYMPKSQEA